MGQGLYKSLVFLPPNPSTYAIEGHINAVEHGGERTPFAIIRPAENARWRDWCLMYNHGNAEDLGQIVPLLQVSATCPTKSSNFEVFILFQEFANEIGISAACYDYGGYGEASGVPSENRCYEDAKAVYEHLTSASLSFDAKRIILFGRSLGSGPATHLASHLSRHRRPFAGLFLQSPIGSHAFSNYFVSFKVKF
jgi:hypothetical protein